MMNDEETNLIVISVKNCACNLKKCSYTRMNNSRGKINV